MRRKFTKLNLLIFLFFIMLPFFSMAAFTTSFKGQFIYDNELNTPIKGIQVFLKDKNGNIVATQYTNDQGIYDFSNIEASYYIIDASFNGEIINIDHRDIHLLVKHLCGRIELTGLAYIALDVNGSGIIDKKDLWDFLIGWFVRGQSFEAGPWTFRPFEIDLTNIQPTTGVEPTIIKTTQIRGTGDGNGDGGFLPSTKENPAGMNLAFNEMLQVKTNHVYDIPVFLSGTNDLGGFGIGISYSDDIRIDGIKSQFKDINYNVENGVLKISWADPTLEMNLFNNNLPLFTIEATVINDILDSNVFSLHHETNFVNFEGFSINNATLSIPKLAKASENDVYLNGFKLEDIRPNPVKNNATIRYSLEEASNVTLSLYNICGQKIEVFVNAYQSPGDYFNDINVFDLNLPNGIYIYRLDCIGIKNYTESKRMIVNK